MAYHPNSNLSAGQRAAREVLGIIPRRNAASTAPAVGVAPQRAAPVAAETIDWSAVVAEENTKLGLPQPGGAPVVAAQPQGCSASRAAAIDWSTIVEEQNSAAGFERPGANVDPRIAAMLNGSSAQ